MKRSISGIIRSELAVIENLQFNGYDLGAILEYLQEKHEMFELSLNTFIVSLYRARKKHLKLGVPTKELAKEINLDLKIPKKSTKYMPVEHYQGKNEVKPQNTSAISASEFDAMIAPTPPSDAVLELASASIYTSNPNAVNSTNIANNVSNVSGSYSTDLEQNQPHQASSTHTSHTSHTTHPANQSKLLIKQVRDIFKSKTDISDLL